MFTALVEHKLIAVEVVEVATVVELLINIVTLYEIKKVRG